MIATWLVEIYLSKINTLEDLAASSAGSDDIDNFKAEQKDLEDEFKGFLEQYKVINKLIASITANTFDMIITLSFSE